MALFSGAVHAEYYDKKAQGYWWYQDPKEAKPKPIEPPKEAPQAAPNEKKDGPELFSLQWMRENFERVRDDAIDNPEDKDKMAAYLYMVRMVMDKAQNFSNSAQDMNKTDPLLDASSRIPLSGQQRVELDRMSSAEKRRALNKLADVAGLWFFFDTRCKFCAHQYRMLQTFSVYNPKIKLRNISIDGKYFSGMTNVYKDQGQARAFNISITPSLVMLAPPDKVMVLSLGMTTVDNIEDKMLVAARVEKILPDEYFEVQQMAKNRGGLNDKDFKDIGKQKDIDPNNAKEWVDFLKGKIKEKY